MHGLPKPNWARHLIFAWPELGEQVKELPTTAIYNLADQPTTYDFVAWACMAKTLGAKHVHFVYTGEIQDWKYSTSTAWRRFGNIVLPICEMIMPWTLGDRHIGFTVGHHLGQAEALYKKKGRIEKLPLIEGEKGYVTITIRESIRNKHRDSNRPEWDKFANWMERNGEKVVVIEDGERDWIMSVPKRMRLYSNAHMNFGVNTGPMMLCAFSDAPYTIVKMIAEGDKQMEKHLTDGEFPRGSQLSFANANQRILWESDTCENLIRSYAQQRMAA
jgi:hypothetical protein